MKSRVRGRSWLATTNIAVCGSCGRSRLNMGRVRPWPGDVGGIREPTQPCGWGRAPPMSALRPESIGRACRSRSATLVVACGRRHRLQRKGGSSGPAFALGHETHTWDWLQLRSPVISRSNASHIKQESSWAKQRVTSGGSWSTPLDEVPNISRNLVLAFTAFMPSTGPRDLPS